MDCKDPGCFTSPFCGTPPKEICSNGVDDDANGLVDSADPACKSGKLLKIILLSVLVVAVVGVFGYAIYSTMKKRRR